MSLNTCFLAGSIVLEGNGNFETWNLDVGAWGMDKEL